MKTTICLPAVAASLFALAAPASAFSLDFQSVALGTPVPNSPGSLLLSVPGYGDVSIQSGLGTQAEIASFAGPSGSVNAVNMDGGETIVITFLGSTPTDVGFGYVGVNSGEFFSASAPLDPNQYLVTLSGSNAGVSSVGFQADAVPEPSSGVLLGALGTLALLRRRRA